ncbi:MAG: DUF4178 domain-containing protein [Leptospiraceae bacterium]|nr:DUF4178 domain-containing protein [Leptospiraceae bacterium]
MSYKQLVNCPSCGARAELSNPAVVQVTCSYCESIFVWDKEIAKFMGKKSRLTPAISGLKIGTEGKINGKNFRVLGRVRYAYQYGESTEEGVWDEWFLEDSKGEPIWLSEDMGELIFEQPVLKKHSIQKDDIFVGKKVKVGEIVYTIREFGEAICVGAEGVLPFVVEPDETYQFADGKSIDGNYFLTIEFDDLRDSNVFSGHRLKSHEISYQKEEFVQHKKDAETIRCPSCASPLTLQGDSDKIATVVCDSCSSVVELDAGVALLTGKVKKELSKVFTFPIGAAGKLNNVDWMIVGRQRQDWKEDGEKGFDLEYLLYNPDKGYLWLSESNGHYYIGEPTDTAPEKSLMDIHIPKTTCSIGGMKFRYFESGTLSLTYVDGALPWVAKIGDKVKYAEAIHPPYLYTEENVIKTKDGKNFVAEVEFFKSYYIEPEVIAKAFKMKLPPTYGVSPAQPYKPAWKQGLLTKLGLIVGGFLWVSSCFMGMSGEEVINQPFAVKDLNKKEVFTKSFTTDKEDETLQITINATLKNSWTEVAVALFKESADEVIADDDLGIEYYEGYEDGEHWSEGSKSQDIYWKIKEPGKYKLLLTIPQAETSENTRVNVIVQKGIRRVYMLFLLSFAWFAFPIIFLIRKFSFETKRWAPVMPDSD